MSILNDLLQEAQEVVQEESTTLVESDEVETTEVEGEEDLDAIEEAALEEFAMGQETLAEQMNIVRLNKQTRLLNLTNRTALVMAKKANDSLYEKYARFNALRLQFRSQIVKKYGVRASSYARKLMQKSATPGGAKK